MLSRHDAMGRIGRRAAVANVMLPRDLDIDGAQDLGGGAFLMSFDKAGTISTVNFDDEDIVRFDGAAWSMEFDASAADSDWAAADMDAMMVPEPSTGLLLLSGAMGLAGLASRRR